MRVAPQGDWISGQRLMTAIENNDIDWDQNELIYIYI